MIRRGRRNAELGRADAEPRATRSTSGATRLGGLLRLVRFSIALSPLADQVAGAALAAAGGAAFAWSPFALGCAAALSLFVHGMVLNDLADRDEDAREGRPRPIPSGEVSVPVARLVAALSLLAALAAAWSAGRTPFVVAVAMAALIWLYDFAPRHLGLAGPVALAAIRGLNLSLGAACQDAVGTALAAALVYGAYVAAVSFGGRMEDGALMPTRGRVTAALLAAGAAALAAPFAGGLFGSHAADPLAVPAGLAAALYLCMQLRAAYRVLPAPPRPGRDLARLVGAGLSGFFLIDAAFAASVAAYPAAALLVVLHPVSRALARRFPPS